VTHSFLLEAGIWNSQGNWIEPDGSTLAFQGKTMISWSEDAWFALVTKFVFQDAKQADLIWRYRGRLTEPGHRYTFVLEHSLIGKMEGEGVIGEQTITQRCWALNDSQGRSAFETLVRLDANRYQFSSATMAGHRLGTIAEASFVRV
jgi:hypothetical protein